MTEFVGHDDQHQPRRALEVGTRVELLTPHVGWRDNKRYSLPEGSQGVYLGPWDELSEEWHRVHITAGIDVAVRLSDIEEASE